MQIFIFFISLATMAFHRSAFSPNNSNWINSSPSTTYLGDRFIPVRSATDFDVAHFLLTSGKKKKDIDKLISPNKLQVFIHAPATTTPIGVVPAAPTLQHPRFHWFDAILDAGVLAASSAGIAVLFKFYVACNIHLRIPVQLANRRSTTKTANDNNPNNNLLFGDSLSVE
ncbi:hypothetical protein ACLOJK_040653 [Asimina triloba]